MRSGVPPTYFVEGWGPAGSAAGGHYITRRPQRNKFRIGDIIDVRARRSSLRLTDTDTALARVMGELSELHINPSVTYTGFLDSHSLLYPI